MATGCGGAFNLLIYSKASSKFTKVKPESIWEDIMTVQAFFDQCKSGGFFVDGFEGGCMVEPSMQKYMVVLWGRGASRRACQYSATLPRCTMSMHWATP